MRLVHGRTWAQEATGREREADLTPERFGETERSRHVQKDDDCGEGKVEYRRPII
jgi:hypothetical protein